MNSIKYKAGYKYILAENYSCHIDIYPVMDIVTEYVSLDKFGTLTIKKGFAWDGCSGPTWDDRSNMRGGMIHDGLYGLLREQHLSSAFRDEVDGIFHKALIEDGMNRVRAWYYYNAVRKFAGYAASPRNQKKILTAP